MQKKRIRIIIAIAALSVVFLGLPILRLALKKKPEDLSELRAPVALGTAERRSISLTLAYPGILSPESTITILPKVPGRIERILPREGSYVRKNDLLAVIDDEVVALQAAQAKAGWMAAQAQSDKAKRGVRPQELENAKSTLAQAEKDVEAAQSNLDRLKKLYEGGSVTKSKYEEAENGLASAQTQLANAKRSLSLMEEGASKEDQESASAQAVAMKAQYDLALLQAAYARILAPASGRVVKVMEDAGNMVGPTSPIMVIAQDKSMTAKVAVPESHYGEFISHPGNIPVDVRPIAFPGRQPFSGIVASISQAVDPQSRSFLVDVSVDNAAGLLRSGMYVEASMSMETVRDAVCVPDSAVLLRGGGSVIFVYDTATAKPGSGLGRVRAVKVRLGIGSGGFTQVTAGIEAGDRVVTEGGSFLEDGQEVRAVGNP
jgi:RND family efflux transporter MFP subunit